MSTRLTWAGGDACTICGSTLGYDLTNPESPRESWVCRGCGSTSRDRMYILTVGSVLGLEGALEAWRPDPAMRMLEASGARAHPPLLTGRFDYRNTFFEHELPRIDGVAVEFADLQALHHADDSLDLVMSSDVFEHVRLHRVAFAEIWRALKPGGAMVFQAPFSANLTKNEVLVLSDGDSDIYLRQPEFHAGPALVYRVYGLEVLDELREAGFETTLCEADLPGCRIVPQHTIVARKPIAAATPSPCRIDDRDVVRAAVTAPWGRLDRYAWPIDLPAPRVSVLLLCYNHAETTLACLDSLKRARTRVPFEIVAVDNGSRDETATMLAEAGRQWPRMKVFTITDNCGFTNANNHASYVADGELLLFLNNDTEVRDGWLDALVELMDQRPDAGAVGAKLIYPDGRLQEAGTIVFSDASGWNYGRFEDPNHPDFNYVREVDYASGAALMVRRDLFRRLGGFDARFSPAYYEDTDLCFAVREAGSRVFYCPHAEVVHYEGVTNSTDTGQGLKQYQITHRQTFAAKWASRLREQPAPTGDRRQIRAVADRRARGGRHLMFTATELPQWDRQEGALHMDQFARLAHAAGHHVTFAALNTRRRGELDLTPYVRRLQSLGIMVGGLDRLWGQLQRPADAFERLLSERDYAATLLWAAHEAPFFLDLIQRFSPSTRTVVDAGDVGFVREARRLMVAARDRLADGRTLASITAPD